MKATWKCWLNRLMNRGAGAVRALGFTTRRASRTLRVPRLRSAVASLAVSGLLGTSVWAETSDEGVVRLGSSPVQPAQSQILNDPSGSAVAGQPAPAPMYVPAPLDSSMGPQVRMADEYAPIYESPPGFAQAVDLERTLYRVGNTTGDVYGVQGGNSGYTNFGAFIPFASNGDNALWYFQPRGSVTNMGQGVVNAGVGYRLYTPEDDRTWSATMWWDGDGGHKDFYNQLGMHFSSVGRFLTWRGGFALPIGSTSTVYGGQVSNVFFLGDNLGYNFTQQVQTAMQRYDIEASTPIPLIGRYGWDVGVGMYYLQAPGTADTTGVSTRVEARVSEDIWVNGLYTHDALFGSNWSLNMEFTLPDGMSDHWFRHSTPREALFQSDKRNYRVAAVTKQQISTGLARNPNDGTAITVAHIDPNLTVAGDGTVERPFMSLAEFENLADADQAKYDIIFVEPRTDGGSTNLDTTVTLFDTQRLLGDGMQHSVNAIVAGKLQDLKFGDTTLAALPELSNLGAPGLDLVRLANANEVAGFSMNVGGDAAGIRGVGIDGFNLHDLTISGATEGIAITSNTSANLGYAGEDYGRIFNTTIIAADDAPSRAGISVIHQAGTLGLLVQDNTVSGYDGEDANGNGVINPGDDVNGNGVLDQGVGIEIISDAAGVLIADGTLATATGIRGNVTSENDTNILLSASNGGDFKAVVVENQATDGLDPDSAGFVSLADGGTLTLAAVTGNTFSNNAGDGARLEASNGGTLIVPQFEPLANGTFTDINGNGVRDIGFVSNEITNNGVAGVRVVSDGAGSLAQVSLTSNTISNNGTDAIIFQADDSGTIDVGQLANTISGHPGAFIRVAGDGGIINLGVIENTIFDRTAAGSGGAGILFDASNADISGIIRNNEFLGSTANTGLSFGIGGEIRGGTLDLQIVDNYFNGNADAAIGLVLTESDDRPAPGTGTPLAGEAAQAKLVITDNVIVATRAGNDNRFSGDGIAIIANGQAQLPGGPNDPTSGVQTAAFFEGLIAENYIGVDVTDDDVDVNDPTTWNVADGNAGVGIRVEVNGDTGIGDLADLNSPIDDPELNGLTIGAATYQGRDYQGNLVANNVEGIDIRRSGTAKIDNVAINGNQIQNNLNDGLDIVVKGGLPSDEFDVLDFDVNGNVIRNNGQLTNGTLGQTGRGIQLRAEDIAVMEIDIANNLIEGNWNGGIEARTATTTSNWTGRDPVFGNAGGSDGVIYGVWEQNTIRNNGILVAANANGNGLADLVTAGHGIALGRADVIDFDYAGRVTEGFNTGGVLVDTDGDGIRDSEPTLVIQDNEITGNGRDGIHMYLDKSSVLAPNAGFSRNSNIDVLGNDITNNGEDGVSVNNAISANLFLNLSDNLITGNGVYSGVYSVGLDGGNTMNIVGDGVEIVTGGVAETILTANNNRIKENNGRGVNILTGMSGYLNASWDGNNISSNAREGFYLVNAPLEIQPVTPIFTGANGNPDRDATYARVNYQTGYGYTGVTASWHADMDANHEVFRYGVDRLNYPADNDPQPAEIAPFIQSWPDNTIGGIPVTDLVFTNNIVNGNGGVVPDADGEPPFTTAGGFVMRVGSTNATAIIPPVVPVVDPNTDVLPNIQPSSAGNGGVRARIENNLFAGNVGRDFLVDGFIATQAPRVDSRPDPLIRIDMVFNNNRGGSIEVDFSAGYQNTAPNPSGGPNVKSPAEAFGNGNEGRYRDATSNLGYRIFNNNNDPPTWQPYAGLGDRSLRVDLLPGANNYGPFGIGNNDFDLIYTSFFGWQEVDGPNDPTFFTP